LEFGKKCFFDLFFQNQRENLVEQDTQHRGKREAEGDEREAEGGE